MTINIKHLVKGVEHQVKLDGPILWDATRADEPRRAEANSLIYEACAAWGAEMAFQTIRDYVDRVIKLEKEVDPRNAADTMMSNYLINELNGLLSILPGKPETTPELEVWHRDLGKHDRKVQGGPWINTTADEYARVMNQLHSCNDYYVKEIHHG